MVEFVVILRSWRYSWDWMFLFYQAERSVPKTMNFHCSDNYKWYLMLLLWRVGWEDDIARIGCPALWISICYLYIYIYRFLSFFISFLMLRILSCTCLFFLGTFLVLQTSLKFHQVEMNDLCYSAHIWLTDFGFYTVAFIPWDKRKGVSFFFSFLFFSHFHWKKINKWQGKWILVYFGVIN